MRPALSSAAVTGLLAIGLLFLPAPEAQADHWRKRHHFGPAWWGPGWHGSHLHGSPFDGHRFHGRHGRGSGVGATILFASPRRYVAPPPRVIYVDPDPVVVQSPGYVERSYPEARHPEARTGDDGRYCREVNKTVLIDGRLQNAYGKACYQPDGSWQWVDD